MLKSGNVMPTAFKAAGFNSAAGFVLHQSPIHAFRKASGYATTHTFTADSSYFNGQNYTVKEIEISVSIQPEVGGAGESVSIKARYKGVDQAIFSTSNAAQWSDAVWNVKIPASDANGSNVIDVQASSTASTGINVIDFKVRAIVVRMK